MARTIEKKITISAPSDRVFSWHTSPASFSRLNPPWSSMKIVNGDRESDNKTMKVPFGGLNFELTLARQMDREGDSYQDVQVSGPFKSFQHRQRFKQSGPAESQLEDEIKFELSSRASSLSFFTASVQQKLKKILDYRQRAARDDLDFLYRYPSAELTFLVSGASGLVGSHFCDFLKAAGHKVKTLVRSSSKTSDNCVLWDPEKGILQPEKAACDVVVHLAGENLLGIWTDSKKKKIKQSRVSGTENLCKSLIALDKRPTALICASAYGFYGTSNDSLLNESAPAGNGFLAEVCKEWEAATDIAAKNGIRVVNSRFGIVLSPRGGALKTMLPAFKAGGGAYLGDGRQYLSWICIDDLSRALLFAALQSLEGPVNYTSPEPVTNKDFSKTLARVLNRPAMFGVPSVLLKKTLGKMAEETLLSSTRAVPDKLTEAGFNFSFMNLEDCLRYLLGRT